MVAVALSEFASLKVAGRPAKEYRMFFYDPLTSPIDRSLVGMFRLTHFERMNTWYVPHAQILQRFLKYWSNLRTSPDMRYRGKLTEKQESALDLINFLGHAVRIADVYNVYAITTHEVRFGPTHWKPMDRLIHIYDLAGGSTGYCRLKDAIDVIAYLKLLQEPEGLANFKIFPAKCDAKIHHPTDSK